ncbi:MAG TPA: glucan biosynthesis protein G [Acetobacteraceae bacterium]|nr:glucan biosynthesis protein G [Acetobacteraceae bacterium]
MQRRAFIAGSIAASVAAPAQSQTQAPQPQPFDAETVRKLARERAAAPYKAPESKLPDPLAKLDYDAYRNIRFDPAQSLWRGTGLPFEAQFFHRGWLYPDRVDLFEVADGVARPIAYRREMFTFGPNPPPPPGDWGFAGFRLHAPINRPDYYDEVCVFLGATYFRAVAKNQGYGMSARGLSLKTGDPAGEEFPAFRAFWLERPHQGTNSIVVSALLDSQSCTAAMRFTIRPGDTTVFDVESTLFPRVDLAQAGVGTGTSMFYFDANDRTGIDDYRRGVHDSDGLLMLTGRGEELWRPLHNPRTLQISSFTDSSPRGFGLVQRKRNLQDYLDLEARYERRPSLWVEPIGNWGEGVVQLLEIPTKDEVHDNIVAFWRPKQPLRAKSEVNYTYRLHWTGLPSARKDLARFTDTRCGAGTTQGARLFVLDAVGDNLKTLAPDAQPRLALSVDKGRIQNAVAHAAPELGGWRVSFELLPDGDVAELRAQLLTGETPLTEAWVYRWTA